MVVVTVTCEIIENKAEREGESFCKFSHCAWLFVHIKAFRLFTGNRSVTSTCFSFIVQFSVFVGTRRQKFDPPSLAPEMEHLFPLPRGQQNNSSSLNCHGSLRLVRNVYCCLWSLRP